MIQGREWLEVAMTEAAVRPAGSLLEKGRYRVRLAQDATDLAAARAFRSQCFQTEVLDQDQFDACSQHVLVEDRATGVVLCCFRLRLFQTGGDVEQSYSAQFYDLSGLKDFAEPLAELGRFCLSPESRDPDILRLAWAAVTKLVDQAGVALLFGCSSFAGTDISQYHAAFALLQYRHLAPENWRPGLKSPLGRRFQQILAADSKSTETEKVKPDLKQGLAQLPPLLRSYLSMGGAVSDHLVIDPELKTLHVFTGLEIGAISPARKRLLRSVAEVDA